MTTEQRTEPASRAERRAVGEIALDWWRETVAEPQDDKTKGKPHDRGARAQLKRCADPTEVFFCPAFHKLLHPLHAECWHSRDTAAVVAGVLAHVKENASGAKFPVQMAAPKDESRKKAVVSDSRFRRLLKCKTRDDLYLPLIRIIRLMGGQANVADLTYSVWYWEHQDRFVQRNWACEYYAHAPDEK